MALHGHTKIELTDINTGKVEVFEKNNAPTSFLKRTIEKGLKHRYFANISQSNVGNNWSNFLQGVCLFSEHVNDANLAGDFPVSNSVTAHANDVQSYNTKDLSYGVFNATLSDVSQSKTKRLVWDFDVEHGNGTISSVCIVPKNCPVPVEDTTVSNKQACLEDIAYNGVLNFSSFLTRRTIYTPFSLTSVMQNVIYADENRYVLISQFSSGKLKLVEVFNEYSAFSTLSANGNYASENSDLFGSGYTETIVHEVDISHAVVSSSTQNYGFVGRGHNSLYIIGVQSNTSAWGANQTRNGVKINLLTFDVETFSITNTCGENIPLNLRVLGQYGYYSPSIFSVSNGYAYFLTASYKICAIKLNNNADAKILTRGDNEQIFSNTTIFSYFNEKAVFLWDSVGKQLHIIDTVNNTIKKTGANTSALNPMGSRATSQNTEIPVFAEDSCILFNSSVNTQYSFTNNYTTVGISTFPFWLATINNLDTPVVKTADKTMRITYTLTEEA